MGLYVDIQKRLGSFSLNVKFEVQNNVLGVLGNSGCGKSMTLKCIAGIETPDSGQIVLNDKVLYDSSQKINLPPQKRSVGYLFQNYALFPNMTVEENIGISLRKRDRQRIVQENIKAFYLEEVKDKYPSQLSGGQQQRVAIARIMVSNPEVLLLDEPFSALDSNLKWKLEQELLRTIESFNKSVLFVSHDRDEVYHFCQEIAVIDQGKMEPICPKEELFTRPKTRAAAELLGYKNIVSIQRIGKHQVFIPQWQMGIHLEEELQDDISYVCISERDIQVIQHAKCENVIACRTLHRIENRSSMTFILEPLVQHQVGANIYCELSKEEAARYKDQERINVQIGQEKLLYLTQS